MRIEPLRKEVEQLANAVRRALGITQALTPEFEPRAPSWNASTPLEELESAWIAESATARVRVHTLGYSPDASGYVGGEQTWTITLFGSEPTPRGEIVIQQFQWAGWAPAKFNVPQPILDALRAEGLSP